MAPIRTVGVLISVLFFSFFFVRKFHVMLMFTETNHWEALPSWQCSLVSCIVFLAFLIFLLEKAA